MIGKDKIGAASILVRSGSSAFAHLNESRKEEREFYRLIPFISKSSFWHIAVDIIFICCFAGLFSTLLVLADNPYVEEPEDASWQSVISGGSVLFFDACGSACYYILVGAYGITAVMALALAVAFRRIKALHLYSRYTNILLGIALITTPTVQCAYLTSVLLNGSSILTTILSFLDDMGIYFMFFCVFLRQYQLYRILCTKKKSRCIKVTVRFLIVYAIAIAVALTVILLCEFTDSCPLWAFDIYYFLPGIILVCCSCYCCWNMWAVSFVFRDQHALMRLLAFEIFTMFVALSQIFLSTIAVEIIYHCNTLLAIWVMAAETQGSYLVNHMYRYYKRVPLFEENVILKDVFTILDGSTGVEQIVVDEELEEILLECAKAQYCCELVHFLADTCKVMPQLKYTDNCLVGSMLAIVDKYVRTKQATSLNIESELRLRVLLCASILNEEVSMLNHSSVLDIPQMTKSSASLGKVSVASKTSDCYTEVGLSQPPDTISDTENTDNVTSAQDNSCAKLTTSATSNSSALSIRDEHCSHMNMGMTDHIITTQTEFSHEVPVGREKSDEDVDIVASVDSQSFTPQPKDLKNPQVRCSSKAAYNLGKALEETAVSVCVLLRFSGVLEATKMDPRFVEITQRRARLAKNNMVKIL